MSEEMFPASEIESMSPRLQWMQRHGITTECVAVQSGIDSYIHRAWVANGPNDAIGLGSTEDEALADLAGKHGLRLWWEEDAR